MKQVQDSQAKNRRSVLLNCNHAISEMKSDTALKLGNFRHIDQLKDANYPERWTISYVKQAHNCSIRRRSEYPGQQRLACQGNSRNYEAWKHKWPAATGYTVT